MESAAGYKGPRPFRINAPVTTKLTALMAEAKKNDWTVISMKNNWKRISAFGQ
jgi:hypothetical protein